VRIGIEAPADTTILRAELADQVAAENRKASVSLVGTTNAQVTLGPLAPRRTTAER
jgi:sRNA-binding carbon storage regulator CsrA